MWRWHAHIQHGSALLLLRTRLPRAVVSATMPGTAATMAARSLAYLEGCLPLMCFTVYAATLTTCSVIVLHLEAVGHIVGHTVKHTRLNTLGRTHSVGHTVGHTVGHALRHTVAVGHTVGCTMLGKLSGRGHWQGHGHNPCWSASRAGWTGSLVHGTGQRQGHMGRRNQAPAAACLPGPGSRPGRPSCGAAAPGSSCSRHHVSAR